MQNGQGRGIPDQPVTGAIHAVATHPTDADTIWVGTVGGGIWKTDDGGTTWKPKTDQFPSLSISALALDPNNSDVLWAGTGRKSSSLLSGKTTGLLKSTDGGETWRMIQSEWANQNLTVHSILATKIPQGSGHVVLVGSDHKFSGGLVRSNDGGGGSFVDVAGIGFDTIDNDGDGLIDAADPSENNGLPLGTVDSLVVDPGNINRIYLGMRGKGVFVSIDGGVNWAESTALSAAIDAVGTNNARLKDTIRISLTVSEAAAQNGNRPVYAASVVEAKDTLFEPFPPSGSTRNEIVVSPRTLIEPEDELEIKNAAGETERAIVVSRTFANNVWTIKLNRNLTKTYAVGAEVVSLHKERVTGIFRSDDHGQSWTHVGRPGDIDGGIHPGGQADIHFSMLADRNNPNVIYVGGDRQPRPFPNNVGAISSYGRFLMGTFDATNAADATFDWAPMTDNGANGTAPHADSRAMVYDANAQIIEVGDGGIHKLANPSTPFRQWQSLNGDLRLTEFYSVAMTSDGRIFGGAQDNGATGQNSSNTLVWDTLRIGDGGIVGNIGNTRIFSTQMLGGFRIGSNTPDLKVFGSGSGIGAGLKLNDFDKGVQFIQPWVVNSVDPDRMLFGTHNLYETQDYPGPLDLADILIPLGGNPRPQGDTKVPNPTALVGRVNANAMVYGGMQGTEEKPDIGWIGTDGANGYYLWVRREGKFGKFEPVKSWVEGDKAPNQRVVAIATDPTDWRHVFVLDGSGRVWFSDDGDKPPDKAEEWQWTQLTKATNSLHKFSNTKQFNDIALYRAGNKRVLLVGGAGGLYRLIEPTGGFKEGAGFWSEFGGGPVVSGVPDPFGGGLPNTIVTDIEFVAGDQILVGTMGRGVYTANAGDLLQPAVVEISGGAGNQTITLRRDAARPWLLNIFEYPTGGLEPSMPTKRLPLASIEAIIIDGGEGNDNINIDGSNGLIAVSEGIAVDGGENAGDDDELIILGPDDVTSVERGSIALLKSEKMVDRDVFGREGTQLVLWNDLSIEIPPIDLQIGEVKLSAIGKGINSLSDALQHGTVDSLAGKRVAGLDAQSIGAGIGGQRITAPRAKDDQFLDTSSVSPDSASQLDSVTSVLRRLIEESNQGFPIASIGTDPSLDTLAELRDRLDALDNVANNVQLITDQDVDGDNVNDTQFALQIVDRRLGGIVNLDVAANSPLGEVNLFGGVEFDAEVDLNVTFGFDRTGFFVKPSAAGTPAVQLTDFKLTGDVGGSGRFGFLGVDLTDGTLTVDPDVGIDLSLLDPGTGADADNKVRPSEFTPNDFTSLIGVTINGDPGDGQGNEDMILDGTFGVAAVLGSNATPLFSADAQLKWADLTKPTEVTIDTTTSLASLFDFDANAFVTNLLGVAEHIKSVTGVDVFATKIPLLDKSLNDILGGGTIETFDDAQILDVTAVFEEGGFRKFRVTLNEINPLERGIAIGNVVSFLGTDSAEHEGTIDNVDSSGFVVSFDISNSAVPETGADELIKVARQGSATDMITSWLGTLTDPIGLTARMPTFQDLAAALGIDASLIRIDNGAIELPIVFELDPLNYSETLDFGTSIGGLKLTAGGQIDVEISPTFKFTAGLRITSGVPLSERLFIKENTEPEVTIGLRVTVDDPTASGSIGFLDVKLEEDGSNNGVKFEGDLTLNLTDPGGDGRIVLSELTPGNLLTSFDAGINSKFTIDPLRISADLGGDASINLAEMNISLAETTVDSISDLTNLPIVITGKTAFENFQNITPEMILAALRALIERLRDMGSGGVLDRKLPVIDKSISDLLNVADKLAEDLGVLEGNDFSSASKLQGFLQDQLGNAVTVIVGSDSIQFRLNFTKHVVQSLPFALNLGDSWGLFKVDADGNVTFTADATADVSFGLLTGSNLDLADRVYFDTTGADASKVTITGSANLGYDGGNGFDAHVSLAFFDFDIVGARAFLDATLVGSLIDPDNAGRLTLREVADKVVAGDVTDIFDGNFTGRVQARVPLDGDGQGVDASGPHGTPGASSGDALIEISGKLENLATVVFDVDPNLHADEADPLTVNQLDGQRLLVYTHNLDNLIANAVLNFDNLIEGLEKLVEWGDKLLGIGVLDFELPFAGASLRDAINFFKDPSGPFATIIAAINGSGGLGDNPSDASAMAAAQEINNALAAISGLSPIIPGGEILKFQHLNNDTTQPLTGATFKFRLSVPFNVPLTELDLGLDFFDFDANVALNATGFVDLLIGLGIDKAHDGFYLITDFPELPADEPEISLRQFRITANGGASVDVGFLEMAGTFDPLKNFLQANLSTNLNGLDDDRLTLSELADLSNLSAIVDRNPGTPGLDGLNLHVSAQVDVPLTVESDPNLPSISTNFVMQWGPFTLNDIRGGTPAFTSPLVELRNLSLSPGEFIEKYSQPFLQTLERYNVLAPFIDKLDDPLPIIGGTLFDLLVTNNLALTPQQRDTAEFLFTIAKTIQDFDDQLDSVDGLLLNFGTVGIRPDGTLNTSGADPTGQAGDPAPKSQQFPGDHLPGVGEIIHDLGEIGITFPMLNVGNLVQLFMGNTTDLIFADLPELHVGKELFETIPIYSVGIPYIASATINAVFGGSIDLYVNLSAGLDSSGLSRGLSHVLEGLYMGDFAPGDDHQITPGDPERPEVLLEASVTAGINAKASLLGFDILSVTGKASIGGAVGLDLNDDNDNIHDPFDTRDDATRIDGKFYLPEIQHVIDSAGGDAFCMFDVVGEVFAKLGFEIHVPWAPNPDWSHRWTLVKFDIECEPSPPLTPDFADVMGTHLVFTSSIGTSHADQHSRAATNHPDGDPIEVFLVDKDGDADNGDETLRIRKHGFLEDFGPLESGNNHLDDISELTLITDQGDGTLKFKMTDFGAGNDSVLIDQALRIPVRLAGGDGDDTLTGGDGGGTLLGGAGGDNLAFGTAPSGLTDSQRLLRNARLEGGDGDDQLFGTVGNDVMLGGEGNDTMDGGGSGAADDLGRDVLVGGGGDDVIDGRGGGDTLVGDYDDVRYPRPAVPEEGSDFIAGGGGGDLIWGDNRGTTDTVDGPAPGPSRAANDYIYGAEGSDLVFGGTGNDLIETGSAGPIPSIPNRAYGGGGNDSITGGGGRDSLVGNADNDTITGGDANDLLYAGDDVFGPNSSNMGFDVLTGGAGDDLLDGSDANAVTASGETGIDSILGSRGADDLSGGADRDFIMAGPGNDVATGGDANDDVVGGDGSVDNMTIDFAEPDGADSIAGDAGDDVLLGDNGTVNASSRAASTTESGGSGGDTVAGGAGGDSILGGGAGDRLDGDTDLDVILGDLGSVTASSITVTPSPTGGADTASGGDGADIIIGGDAGDDLAGGAGGDLSFGDYGSIDRTQATTSNFTSTSTTATQGGNDVIRGDAGDDTAIGGQGADQMFGGDDNDDLIGGHNIAGGNDGGDAIDGGAGHDAVAGDNASILRRGDNQSRNTRALAGATLYTSAGAANVTSTLQSSVDGVPGRDITLFDHTATTGAALFGDDNVAGSAGHDSVFGQLGNDRMQGDGAVSLNVSATQPSANTTTDGNDYMEGGGGGDLMFGNLGQDDLVGGSSSLFGLTTTAARPDGADVIYGGAGTNIARNDIGDTTPGGHARDADVIMGDNANVCRILSGDGASTYASFNYDDYAGGVRVIPRAVDLLDYSADGNSANDAGAGDLLHGEDGDDSVHGMSGNDYALGDGQDDHVFGESGDDWLDGGTGDDGMLGDDGKILTSRNGKAEPLYGLTATTQQTATVNQINYSATLYVTGELSHTVDLEPFDIGGADVMYGGLGNDAMHGGAGQDLMSGAEALPEFFKPAVVPTLAFVGETFAVFDYNNPLVRIAGHPLNFEAFNGTLANVINDGADALFGDAGNDWLVGGTQTDRLYGGYGNDVLNTDDNLDTNAGANNAPDAAPYEGADLAFGGAGRDILLGNAPADRLIDWVGEFNNYYVPFSTFGQSTVIRQISSPITNFLYAVSRSNGADRTRVGSGLGPAARNGEPFGELGLVTPSDADWNAQNGPPVGPQPQ